MLTPRALRITRYRSFTGISWLFMGFNMVPLVFVAYWNASWGDNDLTISDVEREVAARARGASDDEIAQLHATTASNRRKTRTRRTVIAYARHCRIEPLPGRASDCLTHCVCVCVRVCMLVCVHVCVAGTWRQWLYSSPTAAWCRLWQMTAKNTSAGQTSAL